VTEKDRQRSADDRFALGAVLVGGAIAFLARRDPMVLGTGVALGLAGVILALRGGRPIGARRWLRAGLLLSVLAVLARYGLETYQEWVVAQWFAEGHSGTATNYEVQHIGEVVSGLRIGGLASSLATLVGAVANRF
jgi:hypothetical protein